MSDVILWDVDLTQVPVVELGVSVLITAVKSLNMGPIRRWQPICPDCKTSGISLILLKVTKMLSNKTLDRAAGWTLPVQQQGNVCDGLLEMILGGRGWQTFITQQRTKVSPSDTQSPKELPNLLEGSAMSAAENIINWIRLKWMK